ncbi:MAG TPA: nitrile hydratase accessory protein [Acetobacteraceae bacterium]|nr:nitrile hydratase accessory protein [Acetobacteraceae bacterium]
MTTIDPVAAQHALRANPGLPADTHGPVFREPWEAQAFAMTLALHDKGLFAWREWAAMLGETIKAAQAAGDRDTGDIYYYHWLATLERMVAQKAVTTQADLASHRDAWQRAAARTRHGQPIELQTGDFGG